MIILIIIIYVIFIFWNFFMRYFFRCYLIDGIWFNKKWLLNYDYEKLSYKMKCEVNYINKKRDEIESKKIWNKIKIELFE